jgi:hypothetical protein
VGGLQRSIAAAAARSYIYEDNDVSFYDPSYGGFTAAVLVPAGAVFSSTI